MNWLVLLGCLALLYAGYVIGSIVGVTNGWFEALRNPPKDRIEVKPILAMPKAGLGISFKLRETRIKIGWPADDGDMLLQWPRPFVYEPTSEVVQVESDIPLGVKVLESIGVVKGRPGRKTVKVYDEVVDEAFEKDWTMAEARREIKRREPTQFNFTGADKAIDKAIKKREEKRGRKLRRELSPPLK